MCRNNLPPNSDMGTPFFYLMSVLVLVECLHNSPRAKLGVRQQPIKQVSDTKKHVWIENTKVFEAFAPNLFC